MKRSFLSSPFQKSRSYSPAVITEVSNNTRFVELRKEFFNEGFYPASTLVTVAALNRPELMVEINAVAVAG